MMSNATFVREKMLQARRLIQNVVPVRFSGHSRIFVCRYAAYKMATETDTALFAQVAPVFQQPSRRRHSWLTTEDNLHKMERHSQHCSTAYYWACFPCFAGLSGAATATEIGDFLTWRGYALYGESLRSRQMLGLCSCEMWRDIDVSVWRAVEFRHSSLHDEYALVCALLQFMAVPPTCGKTPQNSTQNVYFFCEIAEKCWTWSRRSGIKHEIPDRRRLVYMCKISHAQYNALNVICWAVRPLWRWNFSKTALKNTKNRSNFEMSTSSWPTQKYAFWQKSLKTCFRLLEVYYKHTCSRGTLFMHTKTTKLKKNVKSPVWDDDLAHLLQWWSIFSKSIEPNSFSVDQKLRLVSVFPKTIHMCAVLTFFCAEQNRSFAWADSFQPRFHVLLNP